MHWLVQAETALFEQGKWVNLNVKTFKLLHFETFYADRVLPMTMSICKTNWIWEICRRMNGNRQVRCFAQLNLLHFLEFHILDHFYMWSLYIGNQPLTYTHPATKLRFQQVWSVAGALRPLQRGSVFGMALPGCLCSTTSQVEAAGSTGCTACSSR